MLLAFFVDLVVWFKADKITFDEDESLPPVEMEEMQPFQLAVQYESTLWLDNDENNENDNNNKFNG